MSAAHGTQLDADAVNRRWDVIVAGAGLAGLTAAATAAGGGASVLVLDNQEPGGQAASRKVGRFLFNRGAHALYRRSAGRSVLRRLGVKVTGAKPPLRGAQARLGDRVGLFPAGLPSLLRTELLGAKTKRVVTEVLATMPLWRPGRLADRRAADWLGDLAGGDEGAIEVLAMLTRTTTYVADLEQVSADLVASQLRSGIMSGVTYLDDGWASLVRGLTRAGGRSGVRTVPGTKVRLVAPAGDGVEVDLGEQRLVARQLVLALGTPWASAAVLPEAPPSWATLGPAAQVACLDLGLPSVPPTAMLLGIDAPFYMICHGPPAKGLAPEGAALVHAMRYMRPDENLAPKAARAELEDHYRMAGIEPDDAEEARYLHHMVASSALPLPGNGGMAGRPGIDDTGQPNVLVAGDWVGPAGHLADAALASGEAAGQAALQRLQGDGRRSVGSRATAGRVAAVAGKSALAP